MLDNLTFRLRGNKKCIQGENNSLQLTTAILKDVTFDIIGNNNSIIIKDEAKLTKTLIRVRGNDHKLEIGKNCRISGTLWFEDSECKIQIDEDTSIQGCGISVMEPNSIVRIGKDCMLSYGVDIRNSDSHSILDCKTNKRINYAENIDIGNHVWIGANVQILKGVSIGDESIIAARSVVTNSVPQNCLAAGVPAKVIRTDVTWKRERVYEDDDKKRKAYQA